MAQDPNRTSRPLSVRYFTALALGWTVAVGGLFAWDMYQDWQITRRMAFGEARAHFNKDQAFRLWATDHGRIYVPRNDRTPPDPYLDHIPERDIETPAGRRLTLMNPARMVREMNEEYAHLYGVPGRITALDPLRPANAPDPWERRALRRFREGAQEVSEFTTIQGEPFLRLMRPMEVQPGCLLCHRDQDMAVGGVGGGVGVSVPLAPYYARQGERMAEHGLSFGLLWLVGLAGIGFGGRRVRQREREREEALEGLRTGEARKAAVLESALDCVVTMDHEGRVVEFNAAAERTFGYSAAQVVGRELAAMLIPRRLREPHRKGLARHLQEGRVTMLDRRVETTAMRADGSEFPVELAITRIEENERPFFTAYLRDITERRRAEEALRESEERYAVAAQGANDGLWDWHLRSGEVFYSQRWKAIVGCEEEEVGDHADEWLDRIHPDDRKAVWTELNAHLDGVTPHFENEHRVWHKEYGYRWVVSRGLAVRGEDGKAVRIAGSLTDINERKVAEEQLRHDALHDALTGLCNRALFLDHVERAIRQQQRFAGGKPERSQDARRETAADGVQQRRPEFAYAVFLLDLDRFNVINDSLGHAFGDDLLVTVGERLRECTRAGDTVARLGGDEFALLVEDVEGDEEIEATAQRLQEAVRVPVELYGHEVSVTASIGIATGRQVYRTGGEVVRDADTAMYQAKRQGKACHTFFDSSMHTEAVAQLHIESGLRRAVEQDELALVYQPIVSLEDGRINGFEALLRWHHPEHGVISPADFIPVAEETGIIIPIGEWVLRTACREVARWRGLRAEVPWVSVNVSPKQLVETDLPAVLAEVLEETGIEPSRLKLEITESTLVQPGAGVADVLARLRALGVSLCIDDFGTGYSAMSYLHDLPVGVVKIDRTFVGRIGSEGRETVRAIIAMSHNLGLDTVAEGVETWKQREVLRAMGCPQAQGFLFSRPVAPDAAEAMVAEARRWEMG